jgi:hypothetical protein
MLPYDHNHDSLCDNKEICYHTTTTTTASVIISMVTYLLIITEAVVVVVVWEHIYLLSQRVSWFGSYGNIFTYYHRGCRSCGRMVTYLLIITEAVVVVVVW